MDEKIIKRKGTKANMAANRILKQRWIDRGLCWCEIRLPECLGNYLLQNVHRNKRWVYKGKVELLTQDSEVVLGCQNCHNQIEDNKTLREEVFNKLRNV